MRVRITPEYPGLVISDTGEIQGPSGRWLRPAVNRRGYLRVTLCTRGQRRNESVHVIVCTAFHGPRPTPDHEVAHYNGDPADNNAGNLRWATYEENRADMVRHGRRVRGSRHGRTTLTEDQVREMRELRTTGALLKDLADQFQVSTSTAHRITTREVWTHIT